MEEKKIFYNVDDVAKILGVKQGKAYEVIRKLNLVGYRIGKATFSSLHANFIINLGKAKAKDIYVLIRLAKKMALVYENIHLEEEVILYNFRHFNF